MQRISIIANSIRLGFVGVKLFNGSGLLSWKKKSWSLDMKVINIIIQWLGNWLFLLLLVLGQKIRDWTSMKYGRSCQNKPSDAT